MERGYLISCGIHGSRAGPGVRPWPIRIGGLSFCRCRSAMSGRPSAGGGQTAATATDSYRLRPALTQRTRRVPPWAHEAHRPVFQRDGDASISPNVAEPKPKLPRPCADPASQCRQRQSWLFVDRTRQPRFGPVRGGAPGGCRVAHGYSFTLFARRSHGAHIWREPLGMDGGKQSRRPAGRVMANAAHGARPIRQVRSRSRLRLRYSLDQSETGDYSGAETIKRMRGTRGSATMSYFVEKR